MNAPAPASESQRRVVRKRTLLVCAGVVTVLLAAAAFMLRRAPAPPRWNLVIVTFDTTRADHIGCYGNTRARTPTLDSLARDGVVYRRCFTPAPVTLPAHASLMTGLTPLRHGIHDNGLATLAPEADTLAEMLGRAGYSTAAFVGAFVLDHQYGLAQGFEHYDDVAGGETASEFCYAERNARLVTDAALDFLARGDDRPAFVWIHYYDPHAPYKAPGFDPTFSSLTDYDAEICFADAQLRRVVDYFDAHADRPTLIVVAADHGEGLGDHGEATHGQFAYNSTLHVPLIVQFPKREHAGTQVDSPVSLVDVLPSVLEWLHLSAEPIDIDGRPLPLAAKARVAADAVPRSIYFENYFVADNFGWSPLVGVISGDMKYIHAPRPELFNMATDRWEEKNLDDSASAESREMAEKLKSLVADLSARGRFAPQQVAMSAGDLAKLQSLGYVGGERAAAAAASSPLDIPRGARDAKDMVPVLESIQAATIALEKQQPKEAGTLLLRIVTTDDPGNPRAVRLLAPLIEELPDMRPQIVAALAALRAQKASALDVYALAMFGIGLYEEARYQEAADVLADVVHAVPQHATAYRYLGDAQWQLGHKSEAARAYQQAIDLAAPLTDPPDWLPHARDQLARCLEP